MKFFSNIFFAAVVLIILTTNAYSNEDVQPSGKAKFPTIQQVKDDYNNYWNNIPLEKRRGWKQYKRWEWFWETRTLLNGEFPDLMKIHREAETFRSSFKKDKVQANKWSLIGPGVVPDSYGVRDQGLGRVNIVRIDPNEQNIIWAGAASGGVWKSVNGGASWENFPFTEFMSLGVSDIAIAPSNTNIVYVATGDLDGVNHIPNTPFSIGVIKTLDGGRSWKVTNLAFYLNEGRLIGKLLVHPENPNIVIATTNSGIYKTTDGGDTWSGKFSESPMRDMEFMPGNPNIVYATTYTMYAGSNSIYKSSDEGDTWKRVKEVGNCSRIVIGTTFANPDNLYALCSKRDQSFHSFLVSYDQGESWEEMSSDSPNILGRADGSDAGEGQSTYDLAVAIAPYDENEIYIGGINIWKSNNGGNSWKLATHWYGGYSKPLVHADIHDLVYDDISGNLFVASDGGVNVTKNGGNSWPYLSQGMSITQFYRIGSSATNENIIYGGSQDNGTSRHDGNNKWSHVSGGDGMNCAVDYTDPNRAYVSLYYGQLLRTTDGNSFGNMLNMDKTKEMGGWITPFVIDPQRPNILYAGYINVWKTTNYGQSWNKTAELGNSNTLYSLAVSPSNPDYVYAASSSKLWVSSNGGNSWGVINSPASNISSITVDPNNAQRIWLTISGFSAKTKVFEYDGSKWKNISGNLPNVPTSSLVYQLNSPDRLYLATDIGVYYTDYGSAFWEPFGEGLPNVVVTELEIHEKTKKLRAGTFGRGIWEAQLMDCNLPSPELNIYGDTKFCQGDSVVLESRNEYSSYQWSTGETTKSIVIKESGSYYLQITGDNGCKSRSKAIEITLYPLPDVIITPSRGYPNCDVDTVDMDLAAKLGFARYLWSTGDTTRKITVKQEGTYEVRVYTKDGCSKSTSFTVMKYKSPPKPTVTRIGNTLESSPATGYQWYLGDNKIPDAVEQTLKINQLGAYKVQIFNEGGCSSFSDTIQIETGISGQITTTENIRIHPNPGEGLFNLDITGLSTGNLDITVKNIIGIEILNIAVQSDAQSFHRIIDLQKYPEGVYFLSVRNNEKEWIVKIVKEK